MASFTARDAALAVDCPKCHTEGGDTCWALDGSSEEPVHPERIDELRRLLSEALEKYDELGMHP